MRAQEMVVVVVVVVVEAERGKAEYWALTIIGQPGTSLGSRMEDVTTSNTGTNITATNTGWFRHWLVQALAAKGLVTYGVLDKNTRPEEAEAPERHARERERGTDGSRCPEHPDTSSRLQISIEGRYFTKRIITSNQAIRACRSPSLHPSSKAMNDPTTRNKEAKLYTERHKDHQ